MSEGDSIIENPERPEEEDDNVDDIKFDIRRVLGDFVEGVREKLTGQAISQYLFAFFAILALLLFVGLVRLRLPYKDATANVCSNKGCLMESSILLDSIDKTVDPCSDFYQYACGNFDRVSVPNAFHYDTLSMLKYKNQRFLENYLKSLDWAKNTTAYHKMSAIYNICMAHSKYVEATQGFHLMVKNLYGWNLFNSFNPSMFNRRSFFLETKRKHRISAIFRLVYYVGSDQFDLRRPDFFTIRQGPYHRFKKRMERYKATMIKILETMQIKSFINSNDLKNCEKCNASYIAEDIMNTESKLIEVWSKKSGSRDSSEFLHFGTLHRLCPSIPWERSVQQTFGNSISTTETSVIVPDHRYIEALSDFMDEISDESFANYIWWGVAQRYLPAMGPVLHTLHNRLRRITLSNRFSDRRTECFELVKSAMPLALRSLLYKHGISKEAVNTSKSFYEKVNSSLQKSFTWMNMNDSGKASRYWDTVIFQSGLSRLVKSDEFINDYYKSLKVSLSYFQTIVTLDEFATSQVKNHLSWILMQGLSFDEIYIRGSVDDTRLDYDAFHHLVVPFGAMQQPLYGQNLPEYLNMAGLGSLITAQIIKIFFDTAILNLSTTSWMTDTSPISNMVNCLITNFAESEVNMTSLYARRIQDKRKITNDLYTVKVDPSLSRLDLTSKYWSFLVAEQFMNSLSEEKKLTIPGKETKTADRAFYLALAQTQCEYYSPTTTYFAFFIDNRFPSRDIVNKMLHNSDTFKKAFNCPATPSAFVADVCSPK